MSHPSAAPYVPPRDPTSGEYIVRGFTPPDVIIGADGITDGLRHLRHEALLDSGFIPAVSGGAEKSGTGTAKIKTWWGSHFIRAEYQPDSSGFP